MNKLYDLQLFAGEANTQTTGHGGLSAEMKTYYGMELLENAKPQLVHNQFAATKPLPTGGGKTVEWRKFGSFEKALTPLTEGVTPDGSGISVSYITKELAQYGDYTTVSDLLDLTAIDDVVLEITDRHGSNMGLTLDTVTRNEIQQGSQVIYAPKLGADGGQTAVLHRYDLTEGCKLTSELVAKAATQLKKMNAPTFEGKYVCILHPSVAFDLRQDPAWVAAHQYAAATELFSGEIGELHGVRFVETTEAKIYRGEDLAADSRTLKVNGNVMASTDVTFNGGTVAAGALAGRYVVLDGVQDPGNVGAVLRTADAFGCTGALLLPGCADPYGPKTLRAAMGAVFRLPLYTVGLEDLPRLLADAGLPLYGTALRHDTVDVRQRDLRRCALVIGSEGRGVSAEVLALCRETLRIPMSPHCESLNAAAAAAVLLWEAYRAEEGN